MIKLINMPSLSIDAYAPKEKLDDTDLLFRVLGEYSLELGMKPIHPLLFHLIIHKKE